jgi:hypothetical protein
MTSCHDAVNCPVLVPVQLAVAEIARNTTPHVWVQSRGTALHENCCTRWQSGRRHELVRIERQTPQVLQIPLRRRSGC